MSRNEKDNFVATKEEKTFDDNGNIQVAEVDKKTKQKKVKKNVKKRKR